MWDKEKINNKLGDLTPIISIITLNVHELNMPCERQSLGNQLHAICKKHVSNIKAHFFKKKKDGKIYTM